MYSNKPYLVRAFYEWILDNSCTPYIVIKATLPGVRVPTEYVEKGEIILDISPSAVRDLVTKNDKIEFRATFGGVIHFVSTPIRAVLAIYAQENGQGMVFEDEDESGAEWPTEAKQPTSSNTSVETPVKTADKKISRAHLTLVE